MKKKILALATAICMAGSLAACGGSESETEKTEGKITLGQYKGIEVEESVATITDKELKDYIDYILQSHKTTENVEKGTTKKDDKIIAVYTATKDGEKVSDLSSSSSGSTVTLSKDGFAIDGFVDKLVDKNVGDKVEFDITIQDDFSKEEYRGKTVHYVVEIKAIVVTTVPELTDEWVKKTYGYLKLNTVDEFKAYQKETYLISTVYDEIRDKLLENQKVESYDSEELDEYTELYKAQFVSQLSYYYSIQLDAYLQAMDMTEEEFTAQKREEAKDYLKEKMFVLKVAETENITITDEEYAEKMGQYAKDMGLESESELVSYYSGVMDEADFKYAMIGQKVQKFICENIKVVPDTEKETESGKAETEKTDTETKAEDITEIQEETSAS